MFRRIGLRVPAIRPAAICRLTIKPAVTVQRSFATATAPPDNRKWYMVEYDYVPDILEKRPAHRAAHLAAANAAKARGEFVLGGALVPASNGARIVFRVADKSTVEQFVKTDPYVVNGLVTAWRIKEWTVVIHN